MSDESNCDISDVECDDNKHATIVENVINLNKAQHLKKPSRTEPTLQISEYNLVKSVTGHKGSVQIDNLAKVLKTRKKHVEISKKVESTNKKAHSLPKPLEKSQAAKIRRSVGYEKNRFLLDRWEAFVTSNRAQAHQVFPLGSVEKLKVETKKAGSFPSTWTYKSDLQKELEKLDNEVEEYQIEDENKDEFPLTLEELKEKRREAAKLRAHQSYKEAKARRQNKIKSKKYHRILRKEKIKQKLKEFEELQKTNPEEALKKLDEIEKARVLERFSLRHKGSGQWAKSKQVRAKYDKESRQVLAQQLQISRELTQKQKHLNSDSEDEGFETEETSNNEVSNSENPWVSGSKTDKEIREFVSGYKKFWTEQNKKSAEGKPNENGDIGLNDAVSDTSSSANDESDAENKSNCDADEKNKDKEPLDCENISVKEEKGVKIVKTKNLKRKKYLKNDAEKTVIKKKAKLSCSIDEENNKYVLCRTHEEEEDNESVVYKEGAKVLKKKTIQNKKSRKSNKKASVKRKAKLDSSSLNNSSGSWDIEDIFNKAEKNVEKNIKVKLSGKNKDKKEKKIVKKSITKKLGDEISKKEVDLSMPTQSKKHIINEQMVEEPLEHNELQQDSSNFKALKSILDNTPTSKKKTDQSRSSENIDPNEFMKPKPTTLDSAAPDLMVADENSDNNQRSIIMEAFEDSDIVDDFTKEKQDEIEKDKPQDIDFNLPGWGSWAGTGIDPKKQRKRKRFIIKMPKEMPRRDDNKGALIINEKSAAKIKTHLVSEVPFPFKTVKDFEASIRAPIGNTFVPELAFRKYIRPAVETKMGSIIEPVDTSFLMGKPKS